MCTFKTDDTFQDCRLKNGPVVSTLLTYLISLGFFFILSQHLILPRFLPSKHGINVIFVSLLIETDERFTYYAQWLKLYFKEILS